METADLTRFSKQIEELKRQEMETKIKIDNAKKEAEELKATLKDMGYESLDAAIADYNNKVQQLEAQDTKIKEIIGKIRDAEQNIPTKEAILEEIRKISPEELEKPEENKVASKLDSSSSGDMFADIPEEVETVEESSQDDIMGGLADLL